jgi:hypothetical protein
MAPSDTFADPLSEVQQKMARFAPTRLEVDVSQLSNGDSKALVKLIEAARLFDGIFMTQLWSGNRALYEKLRKDKSALGRARLHYFWLNKGPWSELDHHAAFLPGVPERKPQGANFYPEDMTKEEFEKWSGLLSSEKRKEAEGFFTVIRRAAGKRDLTIVPYSVEYRAALEPVARLLRDAAALTDNGSLKRFLNARAGAFSSNDYYGSDVAWMDLDAPLDITIGPYETYNDELFGYKAAFEAYVNVRDDAESKKLQSFSQYLQEIENNLPIESKYRNPKIGASAPIRVVNQVIAAGDAAHGVRTAAYNLPNDERVVREKGSKRVMLKNVQQAKFSSILVPIAERVLSPEDRKFVDFDSFFTHILAHELSHGIGPTKIGESGTPRQALKELYSTVEEAKADVTGLYMLQYLHDAGKLPASPDFERRLYTTYLASAFRTLRFGLSEAHGKGMAIQFNYLARRGGFRVNPDGSFSVDLAKMKPAVKDIVRDLLTMEAIGDYSSAKDMMSELAVLSPELKKALAGLESIPTDIDPISVTADRLAPPL